MKSTITAATLLMMVCTTYAAGTDKTLVAWVTLEDKNVRAGSVLTIQDGPQFDGIVFAEKDADKWMAGSDNFSRTQTIRDKTPKETADNKVMVQMAIIYEGNRISIYRNADLYASYESANIDLLSRKNNIAVFGLRHVGGGGSIAGSIEDARIYSKALTVDEIKTLEPNKASDIKPYAWWDFEGEKVVDRSGQYPHQKLSGGAKLADGKLVLGQGARLVAGKSEAAANQGRGTPKFTGPYVPETPAWPDNPPDNWPIYHLAHPTFTMGSPFDPNPAFFYKGRYHLHYIYKNQAGFVFAHVSSTDMVRWKWHATVLAPPTTGHGMFSGTGFFTKDGQPAMVYHGQGSGRNLILYGLDNDLNKWSKPQVMLPKDKDGKLMEKTPYFDPDIWRNGENFYGLNGVSNRKPPQIMKSDDLKDWTYIGELLHPDFDEEKLGVKKSEDISCPNIFKLGDKWILICISHRLGCRYFIGDFQDEQFLPEYHALLGGNSRRYFAPESLLTPDGRRVNWTWFFGGEVKGVQSLPTELELPPDGVLRMRPIRELESLRYDEKQQEKLVLKKDTTVHVEGIKGDHLELKLEIKDSGDQNLGVDVLCNERGQPGLRIQINREKNLLEAGNEKAPFMLKNGESLTLRIFIDATLVEVFANDRQVLMNDKGRAAGAKIDDGIAVFSIGCDLTIDTITAWKMKSAYGEN